MWAIHTISNNRLERKPPLINKGNTNNCNRENDFSENVSSEKLYKYQSTVEAAAQSINAKCFLIGKRLIFSSPHVTLLV